MDESQNQQHPSEADIYKRIKVLGSGSYGRAFLVEEKETKQQWVIKQINLTDLAPEEQQIALKEAKILEMLDHQNIVKFKQVYRTAKMKLNIVMQYASGGDLAQRIKQAKEKNKMVSASLHGSEVHPQQVNFKSIRKIIHRDLKAQNVFLTQEGLVKLGDFGVAKILQNTVSKARTVVGSPYYLSPQIIQNKPYSFKTDIWSLGTLLFQMCALHPPFTANNLQFLALKIVQGGIPILPSKYSQGLKALVKLMLQTKQSNRPTIGQIFKLKIIQDTIQRVMNKSKIHPQTVQNFAYLTNLKPPPNLLSNNINENKSQIIVSKQVKENEDSPSNIKPKTPFANAKRGPNNFFNRPISGRRKVQLPCNDLADLADLIQIKPSLLEKHEKMEKPQIPLPIVNKIPSNQKVIPPILQKIDIRKTDIVRQKPEIISPPTTAFSKKRPSVGNISVQKKQQITKNQHPKVIKHHEVKKQNITEAKKQKESKKFNTKVQIKKKTIPTKRETSDIKLEIFSEQAKKKIQTQKKTEKKISEKSRKTEKTQKTKKKIVPKQHKQQKVEPVMQQQKFNCDPQVISNQENLSNYYSNYEEDQFESYSQQQQSEDDLTFSITHSQNLGNNFQKLMHQLQRIKKLVEDGQDIDEMINQGDTIPELIVFSNEIREDDTQFESNSSKIQPAPHHIKIDLASIRNQQQLQNARVQLQEAMGIENTLFVYHKIEEKIDKQGLKFGEEDIVSQIISDNPQVRKETLKKYLGLIVAILMTEKNMF